MSGKVKREKLAKGNYLLTTSEGRFEAFRRDNALGGTFWQMIEHKPTCHNVYGEIRCVCRTREYDSLRQIVEDLTDDVEETA